MQRFILLAFAFVASSAFAQPFDFYPEMDAYQTHTIPVSDGHSLYVEEVGNPKGIPMLYLHGGPGAGVTPKVRRFFDPDKYRIILFDQRGAGKSTAPNILYENTTPKLVADMEVIRKKFGLQEWTIFGGSWGSTLALAYAQEHPEHTRAMILRGVFLARPEDSLVYSPQIENESQRALFRDALFSAFYPDRLLWPQLNEKDLLATIYQALQSTSIEQRRNATRAWVGFGHDNFYAAIPDHHHTMNDQEADAYTKKALIEVHYALNDYFLSDVDLLDSNRIAKIKSISTVIVHGENDRIVNPKAATDLHKALDNSVLYLTENSGHAMDEPQTRSRLIEATRYFSNSKCKLKLAGNYSN